MTMSAYLVSLAVRLEEGCVLAEPECRKHANALRNYAWVAMNNPEAIVASERAAAAQIETNKGLKA